MLPLPPPHAKLIPAANSSPPLPHLARRSEQWWFGPPSTPVKSFTPPRVTVGPLAEKRTGNTADPKKRGGVVAPSKPLLHPTTTKKANPFSPATGGAVKPTSTTRMPSGGAATGDDGWKLVDGSERRFPLSHFVGVLIVSLTSRRRRRTSPHPPQQAQHSLFVAAPMGARSLPRRWSSRTLLSSFPPLSPSAARPLTFPPSSPIQQNSVVWPSYPFRIASHTPHPALHSMRQHLKSLPFCPLISDPDPSHMTEVPLCESTNEMRAAFKRGTVHFSGRVSVKQELHKRERLVFKMNPAAAGMGSALYRRFGSDRFLVRFPPHAVTLL